jgi:hypothetical protein
MFVTPHVIPSEARDLLAVAEISKKYDSLVLIDELIH